MKVLSQAFSNLLPPLFIKIPIKNDPAGILKERGSGGEFSPHRTSFRRGRLKQPQPSSLDSTKVVSFK